MTLTPLSETELKKETNSNDLPAPVAERAIYNPGDLLQYRGYVSRGLSIGFGTDEFYLNLWTNSYINGVRPGEIPINIGDLLTVVESRRKDEKSYYDYSYYVVYVHSTGRLAVLLMSSIDISNNCAIRFERYCCNG